MKKGTQKVLPRKTLRVATTFTGVAACAAAFVPTAAAAATTHRPQKTYDQHATGALRKGGAHPLAITEKDGCPGGTSDWIHLGYFKETDACFGGSGKATGSLNRPVYYATSFCGGNNLGWISGYLTGDNNDFWDHSILHGTTYFKIPHTSQLGLATTVLSMYGWSGHDGCKFP
jgi:hypothetical protein